MKLILHWTTLFLYLNADGDNDNDNVHDDHDDDEDMMLSTFTPAGTLFTL